MLELQSLDTQEYLGQEFIQNMQKYPSPKGNIITSFNVVVIFDSVY
jgi:hypothetical protein